MDISTSVLATTLLAGSLFVDPPKDLPPPRQEREEKQEILLKDPIDLEQTIPDLPKPSKPSKQRNLRGIILVPPKGFGKQYTPGIHTYDLEVPGGKGALKAYLEPYLNKKITEDLVQDLQQEIIGYYQDHGEHLSYISIPSQEVVDGIVVVTVQKAKIGDVKWTGHRHFSQQDLATYFTLQSGDEISQEILLNDVTWLNRNPFRSTEVLLQPGKIDGTTDVEMRTHDRRKWRVYVGSDNTGTEFTGNTRLYAGFNWGDALWRGDLLTYQYTCDPHINEFQAHFGQYVAFLPQRHMMTIYGGYAKTHPNMGKDFLSEGKSAQGSFRYTIPFKPMYTRLKQEFNIGFDWKYTNSNLFFIGFLAPLNTSQVNLLQLMMGYSLTYTRGSNEVTFALSAYGSPGTPLPHQSNAAYNKLREGAKAEYFYVDATLGNEYAFKNRTVIAALARLQVTSAVLLPMQQFSLGGYNSVRGYSEYEYLADDAVCGNLELRLPPIQVFRMKNHDITLLGFLDYGLGHTLKKFGTLEGTEWLMGIGPGVRYRISSYVAFRADYGFRMHQLPNTTHTMGKFHLGGQLSF